MRLFSRKNANNVVATDIHLPQRVVLLPLALLPKAKAKLLLLPHLHPLRLLHHLVAVVTLVVVKPVSRPS